MAKTTKKYKKRNPLLRKAVEYKHRSKTVAGALGLPIDTGNHLDSVIDGVIAQDELISKAIESMEKLCREDILLLRSLVLGYITVRRNFGLSEYTIKSISKLIAIVPGRTDIKQ